MIVTANLVESVIEATANIVSLVPVESNVITELHVSTAEDYAGDYEVTSFCADPLFTTSLILPTQDKHMLDDVTIYSVHTKEEYNSSGGVTFTIG